MALDRSIVSIHVVSSGPQASLPAPAIAAVAPMLHWISKATSDQQQQPFQRPPCCAPYAGRSRPGPVPAAIPAFPARLLLITGTVARPTGSSSAQFDASRPPLHLSLHLHLPASRPIMASKRISKELQVRLQAPNGAGRERPISQPSLLCPPSLGGRPSTAPRLSSSLQNLAAAPPTAISCWLLTTRAAETNTGCWSPSPAP